MDISTRKLRLELAMHCVREQATLLDDLALWYQRQERDLRASYTDLRLPCPPRGTLLPAPQGVWTGPLIRCIRCKQMHFLHRIVCCTLFETPAQLDEPVAEPASNRMVDSVSRLPEPYRLTYGAGTQ